MIHERLRTVVDEVLGPLPIIGRWARRRKPRSFPKPLYRFPLFTPQGGAKNEAGAF